MAEAGLFIGWGAPVRGRESKGLDVFGESIQYWGRLQQEGRIESFEVVLLYPHGGDLGGFALLRGSHAQLNDVGGDEEFLRLTARAGLVIESLGIVRATLGEGLEQQIGIFRDAVGELA
jgi:hypothetical protein